MPPSSHLSQSLADDDRSDYSDSEDDDAFQQRLTAFQQRPQSHASLHSYSHSRTQSAQSLRSDTSSAAQARKPLAQAPSFSSFRAQVAPRPQPAPAFLAHPTARSVSISERASPRLAESSARHISLDSPRPPQYEGSEGNTPVVGQGGFQDRYQYNHTQPSHGRNDSIDSRITSTRLSSNSTTPDRVNTLAQTKHAHAHDRSHAAQHSTSSIDPGEHLATGSRTSMVAAQQTTPTMTLQQFDGVQRRLSDDSLGEGSNSSHKGNKSPVSRLGNLFGWKSSQKSEGESSPTTTFSERSLSPLPSPRQVKTLPVDMDGNRLSPRLTPPTLDIRKANAAGTAYFDNPDTPLLLGDSVSNAHVRELERELQHISQELASSIRREMELEDELDRVRIEAPSTVSSDRRTSDYFSDSGASSARFPITDVDAKLEQMDKQVRKVEQEKANLKVEMASRLQTELGRRRDLEELVQNLEDQLAKHNREGEQRGHIEGKVEELESTLDETRRRLGQEKMNKANFEDLYSATQAELVKYRNEADNLRNEVVPQLKARVEGLEAEASDSQAIVYENTRLQQQLAGLGVVPHSRFNSIAEEGSMNAARMGLSRSGSLARAGSLRRGGSIKDRDGGRQRTGSMSHAYGDPIKEIEDQRDALHKALQLLIKRHDKQQREHERAIKKLAKAKDKAELTPRKSGYTKEVAFLKEEVTTLRKRTEDALEQKWQYEKNLSGLKMDLDRAEQETRGLRIVLQENDITAPPSTPGEAHSDDEDAMLKLSISRAETERDQARRIADEYRQKAQASSGRRAQELMNSAKRMDLLAGEFEKQATANTQLRERLTVAIARGDKLQRQSTMQVEEMQRRLAGMEDSVLAAQQHSETTLANHDAEVRRLEDASSPQLQRLRIAIPEAHKLGPGSLPHSPLIRKSPKLDRKLSTASLLEVSRTQMLERKVKELEGLLHEAEEDMQVVVTRVNKSQMEVADLQTERDGALNQMRKLQAQVVKERENADKLLGAAEEEIHDIVSRVNESQMQVAELQTERDAALTQMRKMQERVVQNL